MTRTLIAGTGYFNSPAKIELLKIWASLIMWHSPECDVLVIDSCSPLQAADVLPPYVTIHRFDSDIGHPRLAADPSRDFLFGLDWAVKHGYDFVVHWETDMLFSRPVSETVNRMKKSRVGIAAPFEANQQFLESQLLFLSVPWLKKSRFIERYRAEHRPAEELSELCIERLAGDDLFLLPLRGMRNNFGMLTPGNIRQTFYQGCDWLSHCDDFSVYVEFLRMNGVGG